MTACRLSLFGFVVLASACSGVQHAGETFPRCSGPAAENTEIYWTGEAQGTDAVARQKALLEAFVTGLQPVVGIGVREKLTQVQQVNERSNGVQENTERKVEMQFGAQRLKDFRATYCKAEDSRIRAEVQVNRVELARLKRQANNTTVALVMCSSDPSGACLGEVHDRARAAAQRTGASVSDVLDAPEGLDASRTADLARSHGASRAVAFRMTAKFERTEQSLHVCRARIVATLWDAEEARRFARRSRQATPRMAASKVWSMPTARRPRTRAPRRFATRGPSWSRCSTSGRAVIRAAA